MQFLQLTRVGIVAIGLSTSAFVLSHTAASGASITAVAGQTAGFPELIGRDAKPKAPYDLTPVTDLPPEPGSRFYTRRPSFRDYTFKGRRFGGSRYKGPPTPFYQTYSNDQTANGFDYGGRCTRISNMCVRNAENTRAGYNSCMQAYGCRED